jgi:glutamate synthase (NADPH/NADH) small chain
MTAWELPEARLEAGLPDKKPKLSEAQALAEANRCLYCFDAPCIKACPTAIDIPTFIRKIGTGNLSGSARVILDSNILGLSCARVCPTEVLCEGDCVYNELDSPPIMIGRLQRVATEYAYDRGTQFFERGEPTGKRVAIVGAGPAGLACAHELARLGHESVIFESRELPGGLNSTGVAPYKLQLPDAIREVDYILAIGGIELRTGAHVGTDLTFTQLEADFDAVFIGVGLGPDTALDLPGRKLKGIVGAVEWIEKIKTSDGFDMGDVERVVVLGGGNTAIDVVRESCGLGVPSVTMVYRRDQGAMSGYEHEWDYAKKEGARAEWFAQPLAYVGDHGYVTGVRCHRMRAAGGRHLQAVPDSEFIIPADHVVLAVGQSKLESLLAQVARLTFAHGRLVTDTHTGQCSNPKYFAGGDVANGAKEVVNAAAEGKLAARGIDTWLKGGP